MEKNIGLNDIAGYEDEKKEAMVIIDIFKNYETYKAMGVTLPKGLLLCGEPGVGKTMLAHAIAKEANVPLFGFDTTDLGSGSELINTLKELFAKAKESAPSILFIDEVEEFITKSGRTYYQSDNSRQALKTLLSEIDGVGSTEGVLVIATVNDKYDVPAALKRSGRLEKQITLNPPDFEERAAIAKLYLERAHVIGIEPNDIARKTNGFTGADIKALVNLALIEAVRRHVSLTLPIILEVVPKIRFGEIKKSRSKAPSDAVCYHEIGHFLAQYELTGKIGSISVETYGGIEGRVEFDDDEDEGQEKDMRLMSVDALLDNVAVCLGGIAGELAFIGKRYCGSANDLENAVSTLVYVISNGAFGFEAMLGTQGIKAQGMGRCFSMGDSGEDETLNSRNETMTRLLYDCQSKAFQAITKHVELGKIIYPLLKERESLTKEELQVIVTDYNREKVEEEA